MQLNDDVHCFYVNWYVPKFNASFSVDLANTSIEIYREENMVVVRIAK